MKLNPLIKTYGDPSYRGDCPKEDAELITAVNWLRRTYPDTLGALTLHIENEGKRTMAQAAMAKAKGLKNRGRRSAGVGHSTSGAGDQTRRHYKIPLATWTARIHASSATARGVCWAVPWGGRSEGCCA